MKVFQIENGFCYNDVTQQFPNASLTKGYFESSILFVDTPDYVFEGWAFDETQEGDARFVKPIPPEGWAYNDENGTFYPKDNPPIKPVPLESQLKAVSDRQDFLEDCIAEMAGQVYS